MQRFAVASLAAAACAAIATSPAVRAGATAQATVREPAQVAVVGNDYAFSGMPTTLAPGKTLFSFENRGKVRHEMSVALLRPGATAEQVLQLGPAAQRLYESIIGLLIARPGESSGGQLYADLKPGRRYVVLCTLKDQPDAQPHIQLGMFTSFEVR